MFTQRLISRKKRELITFDYANHYYCPSNKPHWRLIPAITKWGLAVGFFSLLLLYVSNSQATDFNNFSTVDDVASGQLLFESTERLKTNKGEQKLYQPALLINSSADFNINGIIATVTVTQSFINTSNTTLNGMYTFPLPENSAVNFLKVQIGSRTIEGKITEKNEAKRLFEQASQQGKKASLVEQHRPNLFTNKIANIAPKEQITVTITYVQHVKYEKGQFSLRFPMTITPRYSPVINSDAKNSNTTTPSINNHLLVNALSHLASVQKNNIQLNINLNAGVLLNNITSPSHAITTSQSSKNNQYYQVAVGNVEVPMDKDFILQWRPHPKSTPQLSIVHQSLNNETYALAMLIPPIINNKKNNSNNEQPFARDITFIIDTSGSMQGASITQAKQSLRYALNTLNVQDSFNIIAFESTAKNLFASTMMATQQNKEKANNFITQLSADGGTEMYQPLSNALSMPQTNLQSASAIKQILFITDGAVSNEQALFKLISSATELPRLFTVGIGSAPNGYFMRKAAQFGQGSYTYIGNINDVEKKMSNLLSKISKPTLKNIKVKFNPTHVASLEQYPNRIPDLYADEPLIVAFKTSIMPSSIQFFGELANKPWQEQITLMPQENKAENKVDITIVNKGITSIWAHAKIEDLLDSVITGELLSDVKPLVISTSIKHQIMSPFTSFLAIETETVEPNEAAFKQNLKKSQKKQSNAMIATPFPKTAVGWLGQLLLGLIVFILSVFTWLFTKQPSITKINKFN